MPFPEPGPPRKNTTVTFAGSNVGEVLADDSGNDGWTVGAAVEVGSMAGIFGSSGLLTFDIVGSRFYHKHVAATPHKKYDEKGQNP